MPDVAPVGTEAQEASLDAAFDSHPRPRADPSRAGMLVALVKLYGLYERDAKRLSHSTLDDLPSLFHGLLLGCLLTWCWFVVVAPAKLTSTTRPGTSGVSSR